MLHVGVPSGLDGWVEIISVILHPRRATIELIQTHQVGVRHKWEPIDAAADLEANELLLTASQCPRSQKTRCSPRNDPQQHQKVSSDGCSRCRVLPTLRPTLMLASTTPKPQEFVCWCSTPPSLPVRVSRNVAKGVFVELKILTDAVSGNALAWRR
jgi:hypothetical protein